MAKRRHNFNAGPAALPLPVLEAARASLFEHGGAGAGILELSHRSADFEAVADDCRARIGELYAIPDSHEVLFLQGGASLQFAMVPYNFGPGGAYIDTGTWSSKALAEARIIAAAEGIWSSAEGGYRAVPEEHAQPKAPAGATYLHYTANNTIYGTEYHYVPEADAPLVCDMSSDFMSRPVDVSQFALIYAGAQKNAGPAGVTVLIIDKRYSRAFRGSPTVPKILRYKTQAEKGSMYNTPNTFGIFAVGQVAKWVQDHGGLEGMAKRAEAKAGALYAALDAHPLCTGHAVEHSRSRMNVTWRMQSEAQEAAFLAAAADAGMMGLRGHRSVGGLRASIYNAVEPASVEALIDLLARFEG